MDTAGLNPPPAARSDPPEPDRCGVAPSGRELLEAVWGQTAPELARLVCAMGIDAEGAADVLQDVYLAALQGPLPAVRETDIRRWLFRVTVNRCHLEHRRRVRWRKVFGRLCRHGPGADEGGQAEEEASRQEERRLVHAALEQLEPVSRTVLVLRYFAELNSTEIGKILNLPDSTVRSRLAQARKRLAAALKQVGHRDA